MDARLCVAVVAVVMGCLGWETCGQPCDRPPFPAPQIDIGGDARSVTVGDLDADGDVDLVATTDSSVAIAYNRGDGTFPEPICYPVESPLMSAIADLDGDGLDDVAVISTGQGGPFSGLLSVFRAAGDGTFQALEPLAVGEDLRDFSIAHLDGDGLLDIVVTSRGHDYQRGAGITVLHGTGKGSFVAGLLQAAGLGPYSTALADVDLDGDLDLAVANNTSQEISILLNRGDGTFDQSQAVPVGVPRWIEAADLDADGWPDLVVRNPTRVSILRNQGDGTFSATVLPAPILGGYKVAVADLEGDGDPDIVAISYEGPAVFLHDGTGSYADPVEYEGAFYPNWVAVADMDGDRHSDLVFARGTVGLLLGIGDGTFATQTPHELPGYVSGLADVDGDGNVDLLVYKTAYAGYLPGRGDGTFDEVQFAFLPAWTGGVAAGDLDLDGDLDLVVSLHAANGVGVLANEGQGNLAATATFWTGTPGYGVAVADFDVDGLPDVAMASVVGSRVCVLFGQPDGTLGSLLYLLNVPGIFRFVVADLDLDGDPDIVAGDRDLVLLWNLGQRSFAPPEVIELSSGPDRFAKVGGASDVDADGDPDLVVAYGDSIDRYLGVGLNEGAGTFHWVEAHHTNLSVSAPGLMDLEGDPNADIVANVGIGNTMIRRGRGDGKFGAALYFGGGSNILAADFDRDGDDDVLSWTGMHFNDRCMRGDLDGDGIIGAGDVKRLIERWGPCPTGSLCAADLDGDEQVAIADLLALLASWG